jgi:hypothetical protein
MQTLICHHLRRLMLVRARWRRLIKGRRMLCMVLFG